MSVFSRSLILALLTVTLSACGSGRAPDSQFSTITNKQLDVALYPGFAPVVYREPGNGEIVGMDVDILRAFADSHNLELNIVVRGFNRIWELPAQNAVDIAGSGISRLDSRLVDGMVWSEPYYEVRRSLTIRKADEGRLRSINDFSGLAIGFTPGSTGEFDTRERAPASARLIAYEDEEQAIADLLAGNIDAIARGDVSSLYDATVNPLLGVTDLHYYNPREYFVFALPSANIALQNAFNEFLGNLKAKNEIQNIIDKYLESE